MYVCRYKCVCNSGLVVVVFRKHLKCSRVPIPDCKTFEAMCVRLNTATGPVIIVNVYRPGSVNRPQPSFYDELSAVLETLVVYSCPVIIGGDFNVHVQNIHDADARRLIDLLLSFDMVQHVRGPTHRCGNTIDLVITAAQCELSNVTVDLPGILSDHSLVVCRLPLTLEPAVVFKQYARGWRHVNRAKLRQALLDSKLCHPVSPNSDVDDLFNTYDTVLRDTADRLAPVHVIRRRRGRPAPWFDTECRSLRRECCRLECQYRRTYTAHDRRSWVDATRRRHQIYRSKKKLYWCERVTGTTSLVMTL